MAGLFQALELGKRALLTHQMTLQTIGHNIANVDTPGYSRQRVNVSPTMPEFSTLGSVGTGIKVTDIQQVRDSFLGEQYRQGNKSLGEWSYKEKVLSQIETYFNEPNDNTLSDLMNNFWNSWDDFAKAPDSATRDQLLSQTSLLTNGFHDMAAQLDRLRTSVDKDIANFTLDINQITKEIANMNHQIGRLEVGNDKANDLRDRRDLLLDELSQLIDVNSVEDSDGQLTVYIGAMSIVNKNEAVLIQNKVVNKNGNLTNELMWGGSSVALKNTRGQLAALMESRDEIIPKYQQQLDFLAETLVTEVNAIHLTGVTAEGRTGVPFFDERFTNASDISLNSELLSDPNKIISSVSGAESDNTLALEIAGIRNKTLMNNNTATLSDYYNSVVGEIGNDSREAMSFVKNYELMVQQIDFSRQSVQGVSLDEEMANMVKYQHAYDAAARVITTMDQALDTVINGLGIVGR